MGVNAPRFILGVMDVSGENRRFGGWMLPVIVVAVGAYFLFGALQNGTLQAVTLKPTGFVGLALMIAGAATALAGKRRALKLIGVLIAVAGAIMVIYI